MTIWIIIIIVAISSLLGSLYMYMRRFIEQKRVYLSCLKVPSTGRLPIIDHFLILSGRTPNQGKTIIFILLSKS